MKRVLKLSLTYLLMLTMILSLMVSCGKSSVSENVITDKEKMIAAFLPVNQAIVQFSNLKKGTINKKQHIFIIPIRK